MLRKTVAGDLPVRIGEEELGSCVVPERKIELRRAGEEDGAASKSPKCRSLPVGTKMKREKSPASSIRKAARERKRSNGLSIRECRKKKRGRRFIKGSRRFIEKSSVSENKQFPFPTVNVLTVGPSNNSRLIKQLSGSI